MSDPVRMGPNLTEVPSRTELMHPRVLQGRVRVLRQMFRVKLGYRLYYLEFSSKQLGKYFSHLSDLKGYPDKHYNVNSLDTIRANDRTGEQWCIVLCFT
jgi:hypothetical protein